eukprot:11750534-Heterocapsa_arctica.AAC.1
MPKARTTGHQGKGAVLTSARLMLDLYLQALGGSTVLVPNLVFCQSDLMSILSGLAAKGRSEPESNEEWGSDTACASC